MRKQHPIVRPNVRHYATYGESMRDYLFTLAFGNTVPKNNRAMWTQLDKRAPVSRHTYIVDAFVCTDHIQHTPYRT